MIAGSTVAVTGGAGFIGRRLVERLGELGAARVIVLDRDAPSPGVAVVGNVAFRRVVLGETPAPEIAAVLDGADFLFHLAAEKHSAAHARPSDILHTNVLGTQALFEAARTVRTKKIVFSSSLYAYGKGNGAPFVETDLPRPDTVYGVSKLAGEHLGRALADPAPRFVALRYFFTYGPRQGAQHARTSFIVRTLERLSRGEAPIIVGDGSQALDYSFVDDLVEATLWALEHAPDGETLNVGSGEAPSVANLVERMQRIAGTSLAPIFEPPDATNGTRRVACVDKLRGLMGVPFPAVSLDDGLLRTWRWVRGERGER